MGRSVGWWRHRLFLAGVALKGLDGLLEVAGGALLAVFGSRGLNTAVRFLTQHELSEDPRDAVAGWLVHQTQAMGVDTVHFATLYLLVHGVVKIVLAGALLRERLGVFPVAMSFLGLFILYQGYRLTVLPSWGLAYLTVLDLVILVLVWREYEAVRRKGLALGGESPGS
jgi:uncharacterized membrane protein